MDPRTRGTCAAIRGQSGRFYQPRAKGSAAGLCGLRRRGNLITPMGLLAGTFFPLTHFPAWAQVAAQTLPLTHGVIVIRSLFLGQWTPSLLINIGVLLVMAILTTNWAISNAHRRLIH